MNLEQDAPLSLVGPNQEAYLQKARAQQEFEDIGKEIEDLVDQLMSENSQVISDIASSAEHVIDDIAQNITSVLNATLANGFDQLREESSEFINST